MNFNDLIILGAFAALSLLVFAAASVVGWIYRCSLRRRMKDEGWPQPPPDAPSGEPLRFRFIRSEGVSPLEHGTAAAQARDDAQRVNARVRWAYVTAWLVYAVTVAVLMLVYFSDKLQGYARAEVAYACIAAQLVVAMASMRLSMRQRLTVFAVYVVLGVGLLFALIGPAGTLIVVRSVTVVFVLMPMIGLWFLFSRRLQPLVLLLIAFIFQFIGLALVLNSLKHDWTVGVRKEVASHPLVIVLGLANIILGVIVTVVLLRRQRTVQVLGFSVALAGAALLLYDSVYHNLPLFVRALCFVAADIFQVFVLWLFFKLLVWVSERRILTNELLQTHLRWVFLTLYFEIWTVYTQMYRDHVVVQWGFVLALVAYLTVLHVWLFRLRAQRPRTAAKRLLLLRVFGRADERQDLLDDLDDTWRRIGAVDLIAATDVASRTLHSSMLEAFLLRRTDEEFLRTEADVDERLDNLRSDIEADVRYPVNAFFCYSRIWRYAFTRLTEKADVVLMDLRGFTPARKGSAEELAYLAQHYDLRRVVFLGDRRTDPRALAANIDRELTILDLGRRDADRRALFDLLLRAAY